MEEAPTREWKNAKVVFGCFGWGIVKKSSDAESPVSFTLSRIRFIEAAGWLQSNCNSERTKPVSVFGAKPSFQRKSSSALIKIQKSSDNKSAVTEAKGVRLALRLQ